MTSRKIALQLRVAAVVLMMPWPAIAADYLGKVTSVVDGDTFTMESETGKVICGIDMEAKGKRVDFKELVRMEPDSGTTNIRNVKSKHCPSHHMPSISGRSARRVARAPRYASSLLRRGIGPAGRRGSCAHDTTNKETCSRRNGR
jgi:endonuclease YncB( thermonuclease family)